jgi:hypothetical protein
LNQSLAIEAQFAGELVDAAESYPAQLVALDVIQGIEQH